MRRGSLIFPLILILIGVLFLLNNLHPELSVIRLAGQYWPYLLIGWGLLRCAEILWNYSQGRPMPMAGMNGGEWIVVLFIAIFGSGLFLAHRFSNHWPAGRIGVRGLELLGESFDYPINGSAQKESATRVVIENLRGNARVVAGDTNEVRVTGRTTIRAFDENDAKRFNERVPLEVLNQGGQILIRTNQERAESSQKVSADLDITVPKAMAIQCRGRYGDFDVTGVTGGVEVDSDNAGVRLQDITGEVRIDLRRSDIVRGTNIKGGIEIKGRGDDLELDGVEGPVNVMASYSGDIQFRNMAKPVHYRSSASEITIEKIPGYLRFTRGELTGVQLVGPIKYSGQTKDVRLSEFTNTLELEVNRGDIELRPGKLPLSKMDVRTRNGNIELALPDGSAFELKAATQRGEVENDFGGGLHTESMGRGNAIRGSVGKGPVLSVDTDRGTVTVRKSNAQDADWETGESKPAAPPSPPKPRAPKPMDAPAPATQQ